ncbi:MAG: ABC transporter permease [Candidatus Eremiobacteraeota bacterium]|nr:ABC transporter permease [Candidatus Eremiobacteraeota bacterium]
MAVASRAFEFDEVRANLARMAAIFNRDRLIETGYVPMFILSWANIVVEVAVAFFISLLLHPSAQFGWNGRVGTYFEYLVVNFAILRFQTTALRAFAQTIRDGQMLGTLEVVLATPTSLKLLVLSSGLWAFSLTALQMICYLGVAGFFGLNLARVNLPAFVVFLLLTIFSLSPIGVAASAATMVFKKTGPVEWAMTSASMLFAGVYLPVHLLPHSLQVLSWMLPMTHVLNGFRGAMYGATLGQVGSEALWLCVFTLLLTPIALGLFAGAVKRAKVDGTLALY